MQSKLLLTALVSSFLSVANGAALNARAASDIFDPHIISPNASTVWVVGSVESVTWDTSDAPVNISNGASVVLKPAESLTPQTTLAEGFDLRAGCVNVMVPESVEPGEYAIICKSPESLKYSENSAQSFLLVVFGDSGNISPPFKIVQTD
ncbi:hypothetical protein H2248_009136 [Termitomyces sp. 'cryptogamus']|nr:hypothetical protein H2248_009136 [Termitomyces sp. 'cryptogamus']